jgi:hypothetical protein
LKLKATTLADDKVTVLMDCPENWLEVDQKLREAIEEYRGITKTIKS